MQICHFVFRCAIQSELRVFIFLKVIMSLVEFNYRLFPRQIGYGDFDQIGVIIHLGLAD